MKAEIINNQFVTIGFTGKYEILNYDNFEIDINFNTITDEFGNKKYIPTNVTETTCNIKINEEYVQPIEE